MKCSENRCESNTVKRFGSEWILCEEHLKEQLPHLFIELHKPNCLGSYNYPVKCDCGKGVQ